MVIKRPLVTIAIPFFNNEMTLRDAIVSVLNQSYIDWELILLDDGSTDGSVSVAEEYQSDRVTVISDGKNKGLISRLNEIATLASGTYLARMDGDDVMHPHRIERQVRILNEHPEVDVVDAAMFSIDEQGRIVGERGRCGARAFTLESLLLGRVLYHATVMGRVEWFRSHPYDPAFVRAEDCELWCRTVETSVFEHISEPLYYVREGSINVKNYVASQRTFRLIYKKYGRRVLSWPSRQRLITMSFVKEYVYILAGLCGMQATLTGLRNVAVDPEDVEEARLMLRAATHVPSVGQ